MVGKLLNYLQIVLGTAVMAAALDIFLIPLGITAGGVSGLATVISHISEGVFYIPTGTLIFILNIPILLIGRKSFGLIYIVRSLFGTLCLSAATDLLSFLKPVTSDMLLSSLYGGALLGIGMGLVFRADATTGGTDIAAQVLKKHFPHFSVGRLVMLIDAAVILLTGAAFGSSESVLYSAVALFVCTHMLDILTEDGDLAKLVLIVSDMPEAISARISAELGHGSTALMAYSHYSRTEKTVLMCVVKKYETRRLKELVIGTDNSAFFVISDVMETVGNGFSYRD